LSSLDFDTDFEYQEASAGILVPVRLIHGDRSVELRARLDTGAADCLFDSAYAEILGLPDGGIERHYRTVAGLFRAFGHEVTIETLGLTWPALVFFHSTGDAAHAFVGRRGWLDRLGIVHGERRLFVGRY